jgi:hypothetical protein
MGMLFETRIHFDEDKHEYSFNGKAFSGITGRIREKLRYPKLNEEFLSGYAEEGINTHSAIQNWINTGMFDSLHPHPVWVRSWLTHYKAKNSIVNFYSETLVTDFVQYASMVDIIAAKGDGTLMIADIKRSFDRAYVTMQLNIYAHFLERHHGFVVSEMLCLCCSDQLSYPILRHKDDVVTTLLYGG